MEPQAAGPTEVCDLGAVTWMSTDEGIIALSKGRLDIEVLHINGIPNITDAAVHALIQGCLTIQWLSMHNGTSITRKCRDLFRSTHPYVSCQFTYDIIEL